MKKPEAALSEALIELLPADRQMPATMHDVAAHAGVAVSSVSRVLTDHPHVSPGMIKRVRAAAMELGYEPDLLARGLRSGATLTIGCVFRDIANPLFAEMAKGADSVLRPGGYTMLITNSDGDPQIEADHIVMLCRRRVDGLLVSLVNESHSATVKALDQAKVPVVLLDREVSGVATVSVTCDHYNGMKAATADLVDKGHRHIALITGTTTVKPSRDRLRGFTDAHVQAGLTPDRDFIFLESWSDQYAFECTSAVLKRVPRPSAIVAAGVQSVLGALRAISENDLEVGRDIAFIAADSFPGLEIHRPRVAVIERNPRRVGEEAARVFLEMVTNGTARDAVIPTEYFPHGTVCRYTSQAVNDDTNDNRPSKGQRVSSSPGGCNESAARRHHDTGT